MENTEIRDPEPEPESGTGTGTGTGTGEINEWFKLGSMIDINTLLSCLHSSQDG